jgi:hypothetical protein
MVSIESYVDAWSPSPSLVTVFGFPSPELRDAFTQNPALDAIGAEFDQFLDPHDHRPFGRPPVYRAPSLSAP